MFKIFSLARDNLSNCALVNKQWKTVGYDPRLQQMLLPSDCCNATEWIKHHNIRGSIQEPRLPLDFHKNFYQGRGWKLMLIPEYTSIPDDVEAEEKETVETSNISIQVKFERAFLEKDRKQFAERTHWVTYKLDGKDGQHLSPRLPLVDAIMICFMEQRRSGKCIFEGDTQVISDHTNTTFISCTPNNGLKILTSNPFVMITAQVIVAQKLFGFQKLLK